MSLRAKVTGVTVAVLAIGLLSAGVGTSAFLRYTLGESLNDQVRQLATTSAASSVFDIEATDQSVLFTSKTDATNYFVAIYAPESDGRFVVSGGGDGAAEPVFPETFTLAQATTRTNDVFTLPNSSGGPPYRAAVLVDEEPESNTFYTQLVALPTAPTERFLAAFVGIYSILAILTVLASAFLVRWVVTLTFRSLGQVESTAEAIAGGDFSLRMTDIEPPTTEVGRLKAAINAMLVRIDAALNERDATVRQMRRFIGDASHELRTPLVTVRGYAELYRMGAVRSPEDVAQSMERIEKEAIRMGVLVEDLLALARLDEKRDVEIAPLDLRPIARDAALDLRAAAPQREVTVIDTTASGGTARTHPGIPSLPADTAGAGSAAGAGDVDAGARTGAVPTADASDGQPNAGDAGKRQPRRRPGTPARVIGRATAPLTRLRRRPRPAGGAPGDSGEIDLSTDAIPMLPMPPIVLGDENRIRQVVANLLGNARRYTPEASPIELRVGVDDDAQTGWLEIVDHGEGVPPQIRGHIFERFWRADTSRTRETGGSGLGLSIVASIVETLHGTVGVADTPGGGATFRVSFPLALGKDAAAHLLIDTQPLPRLSSRRSE